MTISKQAMETSGVRQMPRQRIVTDEDVDKALGFLRDSAIAIGQARAAMVNAENLVKHTEALLYLASEHKTVDARKADVRTQQRWLEATTEEAKAAGEFEKLKALREAAIAKIDAWRTEQATFRGMKV